MKPNILIVDDSPVMRRFIGRVLDATSLEAGRRLEAGNGREAIEILARDNSGGEIDLVLADINMPVMDGPALVRVMQAHPKWKRLPVLVVSTDRSEARMVEMQELGVAGYVTKPFSPEQLEAKIVAALDGAAAANSVLEGWTAADPSLLLPKIMRKAVEEVLESMCFLPVLALDEAGPGDTSAAQSLRDPGTAIAARLTFSGPFSGSLDLVADNLALRVMAANFLGEEEDSICSVDSETVLLEVSNMICGAVLHQQDSARLFTLSSPVLVSVSECHLPARTATEWQQFLAGDGWLAVGFHRGAPRTADAVPARKARPPWQS